jgi:hypothetical protein
MAFYANQPLPDTNARQGATTIRPSSTALLTIDSEDRYKDYVAATTAPSSPYNFSITKNESLMPGFMTRLGITEVSFPWAIPNINDKTRTIDVFYTLAGGPIQNQTITLSTGFYRPQEIATVIQAAVRAFNGGADLSGFTMEYGGTGPGDEPRFYYNAGAGTSLIGFLPMTYNSVAYPFNVNTKQLYDVLGFEATVNSTLNNASSGFSTFCQSTRYIDIVCNQLTNSQAQKDQTSQSIARDMLCRLYLNTASGIQSTVKTGDAAFCPPGCAATTLYKNFTVPKQIQWIPNQNIPGYLQFQVYDDSGDLLDNSIKIDGELNGFPYTDWSMTMLISEC